MEKLKTEDVTLKSFFCGASTSQNGGTLYTSCYQCNKRTYTNFTFHIYNLGQILAEPFVINLRKKQLIMLTRWVCSEIVGTEDFR